MDRGLAYGDGVFRTLRVRSGAPLHWRRQYAKLAGDCAALGICCPDEAVLEPEVRAVIRDAADCALKIIITRGSGARGYRYAEDTEPTRVVLSAPRPVYPGGYATSGVKVRRCALRLSHQPALAGVKHLNRLENVIARAEWTDADIAEGILCDREDHVVGGTMTNLFMARGGTLETPKLERCGVAGVTRDRVIEGALRQGIPCRVENLSWMEMLSADELFLVNSLAGVWPVRELAERKWLPGPLTRSVQRWLDDDDRAQVA